MRDGAVGDCGEFGEPLCTDTDHGMKEKQTKCNLKITFKIY